MVFSTILPFHTDTKNTNHSGYSFPLRTLMKLQNPSQHNVPGSPYHSVEIKLPMKPVSYSAAAAAKSLQLCPTLCDPIDGSPPGSPIPGILQARVLEWGAIAF